jgi:methionine-R-sulfoxide reductase
MNGGRITMEEKSTLMSYVRVILAVLLVGGVAYFFFLTQQEKVGTHGFDPDRPVPTDEVLRRRLKPEEYFVVRQGGSETPFQNEFWNNQRSGLYVDVITGEPLFTSLDKYDNTLGIPAFSKPISKDLLVEKPDNSQGMQRIEVRAKRSDAHLGHLFADAKSATGQGYYIQSAALHFIPAEDLKAQGYDKYASLVDKK